MAWNEGIVKHEVAASCGPGLFCFRPCARARAREQQTRRVRVIISTVRVYDCAVRRRVRVRT
jgi:hypothetical protein